MPELVTPKLLNWASELDSNTLEQAIKTAEMPIVSGHVALMPDAHLGIGATVGSVIPTEGAVIPAAVGVDIGCGMIAVQTDLSQEDLPDTLEPLLTRINRVIPAGVGESHHGGGPAIGHSQAWLAKHPPPSNFSDKQVKKTVQQFGTLGSGNHFIEVSLDENGQVWVVLHSGSRWIGNELARHHIGKARQLAKTNQVPLTDPNLAYFEQGQPEFTTYIDDMLWAQDYALGNRERMMDAVLAEVFHEVGRGRQIERINCHHNFAALEVHDGKELWITRKGAIRAEPGDYGVIPGSMGTQTFIVRGKGNRDSFNSCAHGAGRRFSRTQARKRFTTQELSDQMRGKVWLKGRAKSLLDEIPSCYKDINQVMADQSDLVEVEHTLTQVLNFKGT